MRGRGIPRCGTGVAAQEHSPRGLDESIHCRCRNSRVRGRWSRDVSVGETDVLERDKRRGKPAASCLPVALAAPCLAILVMFAYLVLKLGWAGGAPLRCFVLRGRGAGQL